MWDEAAKQDQEMEKRREDAKHGWVQDFFITQAEAAKDVVKSVIILDAQLGVCAFNEHVIMEGKKFVGTEICVRDFANCPLCAKGLPTFVIKLSILDLTPYKIEKGDRAGQVVNFTRKMLTIKPRQRAKWREIEQNCIKQNGTFRGCLVTLKRDKTDANSASIGEPQQMPIEIDVPGRGNQTFFQLFDFIPDATLKTEFGSPEKKDDKGKVLLVADVNITPYDYSKVFPEPDLVALNRKYGNGASIGNAEQAAKEWDKGESTQPAVSQASTLERLRLRGASSIPHATTSPIVSEGDTLESVQQGQLGGTGPAPVVTGSDDEIPFK